MFITDRSPAEDEGLPARLHSSIMPLAAGVRLRSLDNASRAAHGKEDGGCCVKPNGFFLGLFLSLPICVLLWGIILWVLHAILF